MFVHLSGANMLPDFDRWFSLWTLAASLYFAVLLLQ